MKTKLNKITAILLLFFSVYSCSKKKTDKIEVIPKYTLSISQTDNTNAPSLQSFVHGTSGSEWLLFAGRTNSLDSLNGGLHKLKGNYAGSSFTKASYNEQLFVYNPINDEIIASTNIKNLIKIVEENCSTITEGIPANLTPCYQLIQTIKNNPFIFKNSNN